jgi:hypothetical protein
MCTLVWDICPGESCSIFFNRDEKKTRDRALAPRIFCGEQLSWCCPIDPLGEGTWLGVNDRSIAYAIVNDDLAKPPQERGPSRGQLVLQMLRNDNGTIPQDVLDGFTLETMAGFRLHRFSLQGGLSWHWDGRHFSQASLANRAEPVASSSLDQKQAQRFRSELYRDMSDHGHRNLYFQQWHRRTDQAWSPLMSRSDAETVSLAQVHINKKASVFLYLDQPLKVLPGEVPWTQRPEVQMDHLPHQRTP